MTSMRFGGIKSKLQKFSFTPSKDKPPKSPELEKKQEKPKNINYKKKMKQRYNLTDSQFEEEKKIAQRQLKNWEDHRKEQVLQIFQSNSEYISKSKKSDVRHPKLAKANVVMNSRGEKVDVEFGRLKEFYLCTLAPCKEFVSIRDHTEQEKQLEKIRNKKKKHVTEEKEAHWQKKNNEYAMSKSIYETPGAPQKAKVTQREKPEVEDTTAPLEKFVSNTTDEKHTQFSENWYHQSITRTKLKPGKMNYWLGEEEDDDATVDDDPDGKYTVTAERLIETLTAGGKVKDSGVKEPAGSSSKTPLTEPLSSMLSRYKKTCGREANYLNTLKGTIDFVKNQNNAEPTLSTHTLTQDDPTDAPNQITFASTISANVFKGKRIKRQFSSKKDIETFEEKRKDYTREAGEETSGL